MTLPSSRSVLQVLPKNRILELGRMFAIAVPPNASKDEQVEALVALGTVRFRALLGALGRDELKAACRSHGLDVEDVVPPPEEGHATLVKLVCLDDDNQGRALDVLWELELGAKVHQPEAHGLGDIERVDPPRHFAAYLHALK